MRKIVLLLFICNLGFNLYAQPKKKYIEISSAFIQSSLIKGKGYNFLFGYPLKEETRIDIEFGYLNNNDDSTPAKLGYNIALFVTSTPIVSSNKRISTEISVGLGYHYIQTKDLETKDSFIIPLKLRIKYCLVGNLKFGVMASTGFINNGIFAQMGPFLAYEF